MNWMEWKKLQKKKKTAPMHYTALKPLELLDVSRSVSQQQQQQPNHCLKLSIFTDLMWISVPIEWSTLQNIKVWNLLKMKAR